MAETAAEKQAREKAEKEAADAAKAQGSQQTQTAPATGSTAQQAGDPPRGQGVPATPEEKQEGMSAQEKASAGSGQANSDILLRVLNQQPAEQSDRPTYDQNRWKVGEGHSMLDRYVQGEEINLQEFLPGLGKTDEERAYHLDRLIRLRAVVRMADQEPRGGSATGPLGPLMSPEARKLDTSNDVRMALGKDLRERVAGQASEDEQVRRNRESATDNFSARNPRV